MNIFDIARLAGVSRKTVQRVLNDAPGVKPETKQKIKAIMAQQHYEPNAIARNLSTKRTHTIGIFIIQDVGKYQLHTDDLYFGAVIGGIINQCTYRDYKTMITILDISDPEPLMSMYKQKSIDAGIIVSWSNVQAIVDRAVSAGFLIGVFDQNTLNGTTESVPVPWLDNRVSAYRAAQCLFDFGHTDVGILTGDMNIACSVERLDGFMQAAADRGIEVPASKIKYGHFVEHDGVNAVREWIAESTLPKALFCSNDLMAYGVLQAMSEHGLKAPQDLSLVGFDDLLISQYMHPPLSSMRVPRVAMSEALTARLLDQLDGIPPAGEMIFQAELVLRGSCGTHD